jgi:hypothetical protein
MASEDVETKKEEVIPRGQLISMLTHIIKYERTSRIHGFDDFISSCNDIRIIGTGGMDGLYSRLNDKKTKKCTFARLSKNFPITVKTLEPLCPELYSTYFSWFIYGCPLSTDIDIAVVVDKYYNGKTYPLSSSESTRLENELEEFGLDLSRGLDINFIAIEDNEIVAISKGCKEVQNMIIATYKEHKQKYKLELIGEVPIRIEDRLRSLSKFILDRLGILIGKTAYIEYREERRGLYSLGIEQKLKFTIDIVDRFIQQPSNKRWIDTMKSLTMKYIQLIMLDSGKAAYTKLELAEYISDIAPQYSTGASWFLTRGKIGMYNPDIIPFLHAHYVKIIKKFLNRFQMKEFEFKTSELDNPSNIPDKIFTEFLKCPVIATDEFKAVWESEYKDSGIDDKFILDCDDEDSIISMIGEEYRKKMIFIPQRTPKWKYLLEFYTCGKNSKTIGTNFQAKHNLIRGSLSEIIVENLFQVSMLGSQYEKFIKCSLGFVVEEVGNKGCKGAAPDMLLVSSDEIIPVEIKCLKSDKINGDYYRALSLATRQCQSVKIIFNDSDITIKTGLLLFCWYTDSTFVIRSLLFSL